MITWILDQHVDKVKGRKTPFIKEALLRKHTVYGLRDSLIPKPIDLSNIVVNYPTIVRGSHGFVNHVQQALKPNPGGFLHGTNFQLSTYAPILNKLCINDRFEVYDYVSFKKNTLGVDLFVKPLDDLKKFNGIVVKPNQTLADAHTEKFSKWFEPDDLTRISVCSAKQISNEYRVVVVNKKAITGSTYDSVGDIAPVEVLKFADQCVNIWNPADVYVIDIAETSIGYKIVEYNQFSTSAMYNCNESLIIDSLEKFLN